MAESSSWADIAGLLRAAGTLEEGGHRIRRIVSRLYANAGTLTDPEVFGTEDEGGRRFHESWTRDVADLVDGIDEWSRSVIDTADGVRGMARLFRLAEDNAELRAELTGRLVDALTPPGQVGSGPLPPRGADGSGGSGGHGGSRR